MQDELKALGYEIVIVAQDLPEYMRKVRKTHEIPAHYLSDSTMSLASAFGLSFVQNDERYHALLETHTGMKHHLLPVPAVYIVGADKVIDHVYTNVIYQKRLPPDLLLAAAKAYASEPAE